VTVPELFIRRPVMTTLVMSGILLFGLISYRYLAVSDLPNVDYPTILVQANLPGASPETMASAVATPLERQFTTIAGVDSMSSVSALGLTQITIQFTLSRNIDAAGQDVQAAIGKAARQLPAGMPTPPTYNKINPADQPILFMALTSDTLPLSTVDDYGETLLAQRISMVDGVAQVFVYGAQTYAVHVQLDPNALASRGIGIDEVENAIGKANVNLPTGTLYGKNQAFIVQANGQLMKAADYRPLIVAYRQGRPVRLEEVGRVIDSVQNDKIASWFNNTRGIVLAVQRQPGVNTVEVVNKIRQLLPSFRSQIPAGISLEILYDRSESIRESAHDVQFTLLLTVVFMPFPTALVGEYLLTDHVAPAVVIYNAATAVQAVGWILVSGAALRGGLTKDEKSTLVMRNSRRNGYFALVVYSLLALVALWFPLSMAIVTTMTTSFLATLMRAAKPFPGPLSPECRPAAPATRPSKRNGPAPASPTRSPATSSWATGRR